MSLRRVSTFSFPHLEIWKASLSSARSNSGFVLALAEGNLPPCLTTGWACVYVTIYIQEETRETLISLLFNPDEFLHFPAVRHSIFMLRLYHWKQLCHCKWITTQDQRACVCVCACLLGLGNCTNTKHCCEKLRCLLAFMIFESFSFLSSSLLLATLLQPDKCVSLIALMTQCPVSHPLLTGHTCIGPEQRMILSPLSASPLPLFNSELHHLRNQPGHSGFTSSWLCERFVFLILTLCAAEDWHAVSHPARPSTSTKEEPVFQQLLQTDSPTNLPKGMCLKAFQRKKALSFALQRHFA